MTRPRLLDLFCGAGGAAMGYYRAGFDVVGVDIKPQRHYPFEFHQGDAMTWPLGGFDAVHASPPCQAYTASLRGSPEVRMRHPDLLAPVRDRLRGSALPYVIENVEGAPMSDYITLCGSMFGLSCSTAELRRHRLFEIHPSDSAIFVPECQHGRQPLVIGVVGHGQGSRARRRMRRVIGVYGGHGRDRRREHNTQDFSVTERCQAMGIDWMTGAELSQAIPPAYTEFIGKQLLAAIEMAA